MKKNTILILAILSAVLLLGSLPIKWIIGEFVSDICRIVGFILLFVATGLRIFQREKADENTEQ